jgi:hypothetical protein
LNIIFAIKLSLLIYYQTFGDDIGESWELGVGSEEWGVRSGE